MAPTASVWGDRADVLQDALVRRFWAPRHRLFRLRTGAPLWPLGRWNYWW